MRFTSAKKHGIFGWLILVSMSVWKTKFDPIDNFFICTWIFCSVGLNFNNFIQKHLTYAKKDVSTILSASWKMHFWTGTLES